jgi:hypothetical protein
VTSREVRHSVVSALLQAGGPVCLDAVCAECDLSEEDATAALAGLVGEGLVLRSRFVREDPGQQYCWAAAWRRELERRTARAVRELRELTGREPPLPDSQLDVSSPASVAFSDYVLGRYTPPEDKRTLVFLQCSVRRPFSSSPSHASLRRAIWVATGCDPRHDFLECPVHVVVLASKVGPVPYELEDVYPANVRGGGVKHFDPVTYERVKPVLAGRLAGYITAHRASYDHITSFTEGRYGEVMQAAAEAAGVTFPVLPAPGGPRLARAGDTRPRKYWEKHWVQLCLQVMDGLGAEARSAAEARLRSLDVEYEGMMPGGHTGD